MKRNLASFVAALLVLAGLATLLARKPSTSPPSTVSHTEAPFFALYLVHDEGAAPGFHAVQHEGQSIYVSDTPLVSEADYASAEAKQGPDGAVSVVLHATPEGQRRFAAATTEHRGQTMALLVDGKVETLLTFDQTVDSPTAEIARPGTTLEEARRFASHFGRH